MRPTEYSYYSGYGDALETVCAYLEKLIEDEPDPHTSETLHKVIEYTKGL